MNAPTDKQLEQQPATEPKTALDCFDVMDESQMKPGMEAPQLIEWALWAVSDFLLDAHKAMQEAQESQQGAAK